MGGEAQENEKSFKKLLKYNRKKGILYWVENSHGGTRANKKLDR